MKTSKVVSYLTFVRRYYFLSDFEYAFLFLISNFTLFHTLLTAWVGVLEIESMSLSCHAGDGDLICPSYIWLLTYLRRTKFTILVSFEDLFHKVNTYLEIKQNESGLLLLTFAIIWHGNPISKRPSVHKQFQWSAAKQLIDQA